MGAPSRFSRMRQVTCTDEPNSPSGADTRDRNAASRAPIFSPPLPSCSAGGVVSRHFEFTGFSAFQKAAGGEGGGGYIIVSPHVNQIVLL
jgi:hypothetical protein